MVAIETACETKGPVTVRVLTGEQPLSTTQSQAPLKTNVVNRILSAAFADPGHDARITVLVSAVCVSGDPQDGSDQCQMP